MFRTMTEQLLTRREVQSRLGIGRTSFYALRAEAGFPLPIRVGPRAIRWSESEVAAWIASRPRTGGSPFPATR